MNRMGLRLWILAAESGLTSILCVEVLALIDKNGGGNHAWIDVCHMEMDFVAARLLF